MKHEINPNHSGWLLHLTIVRTDGTLVHDTCYQFSSSIEMLKLYEEQIEKKHKSENDKFPLLWHLHLMQIFVFPESNSSLVSSRKELEDLKVYAEHENNLILINS